ncbi:hypothetical protein K439DRAFT_1619791 [Ramaria rubella]|nr:hypothetical protein K439DRAFT_1619791 [Ramaria rubella]
MWIGWEFFWCEQVFNGKLERFEDHCNFLCYPFLTKRNEKCRVTAYGWRTHRKLNLHGGSLRTLRMEEVTQAHNLLLKSTDAGLGRLLTPPEAKDVFEQQQRKLEEQMVIE